MKKIQFTEEMDYFLDKMSINDFMKKYNLNKRPILRRRRELQINNKGEFRKKHTIIIDNKECYFCNKCQKYVTIEDFTSDKRNSTGLGSLCKNCEAERTRNKNNTEDSRRYYREYRRKERSIGKNNIIFNIRRGITRFIKERNGIKNSKYVKYIGCSIDFFLNYIEQQFYSNISWDNYGSMWDLDHIIPLRSFSIDKINDAWNYKNLRPLLKKENQSKNDRMPDGTRARDLKI